MSTLIELVKIALTSAKDRGIDVYIPPDNLTGCVYEFGIPNNSGETFIFAIQKDGSGSFAYGTTIKYDGGDIVADRFDPNDTNIMIVRIIGYLSQLRA